MKETGLPVCSVVSGSFRPFGCIPPGSSINGISQARTLEWVAISYSTGSSQPRDRTCVSCTAGRFFTAEPLGKGRGDKNLANRDDQLLCWKWG